jgi:excisionase family DNA binding protein
MLAGARVAREGDDVPSLHRLGIHVLTGARVVSATVPSATGRRVGADRLTVDRRGGEVARVSPVTVHRLLHEGAIPFHSVGRAYRIDLTDLETHVDAHHVEPGSLAHRIHRGSATSTARTSGIASDVS